MTSDVWELIHPERAALAQDVSGLSEQQWAARSLCSDWTVHQVLAHVVATTTMTPSRFVAGFAGAGFTFTRFNARNVARNTGATPADTLAQFRAHLTDRSSPPGPKDTWIGEIVIHGTDIRRPLGIDYQPPVATVRRVADFYKTSNPIVGARDRIAGMTLRATDADWSHGSGPEVSGPLLSLVLAMTGRRAAVGDLAGDGLDLLATRMPPD